MNESDIEESLRQAVRRTPLIIGDLAHPTGEEIRPGDRATLKHTVPGSEAFVAMLNPAQAEFRYGMAVPGAGVERGVIQHQDIIRFAGLPVVGPPRHLGTADDEAVQEGGIDAICLYLLATDISEDRPRLLYFGCVHRDWIPTGKSWDEWRNEAWSWVSAANLIVAWANAGNSGPKVVEAMPGGGSNSTDLKMQTVTHS